MNRPAGIPLILTGTGGMKKPDACIYEEALRRFGISPDECVFAGDGGSRELEGANLPPYIFVFSAENGINGAGFSGLVPSVFSNHATLYH